MKKMTSMRLLEQFIANVLNEAEVEPFEPETHQELEPSSIDDQIDDKLRSYELEARSAKNESSTRPGAYLREADEPADGEGAQPDDVGPDDDDQTAAAQAPQLSIDDIDISEFAGSVGRLIDDFAALIEVEKTIFRRAHNFLLGAYGPDVAEAFSSTMRRTRMLDDDEDREEIEDDDFRSPPAQGAGPDVGSGGG